MMSPGTQKPQNAQVKSPILRNLTGGLNVREAITDLADNEAAEASNVIFYTAGSIVRRGAWRKLIANSPTSNPLLGIFQAVFNNAGVFTYYLVVTDGTSMWTSTNPTAAVVTWTDITNSKTLDSTQPWHFFQMSNKLIVYNGIKSYYWTGTGGLTDFPGASGNNIAIPISRVAIVWQNYAFWGGDGTNPGRLYFSDLNDPTIYPSANYVDVPNVYDGDQITGLAILYGNLIVFKRFSIYVLQGTPPTNLILSKLNSSVGCIDPAAVVQIDNLVYFVSDKGLFSVNLFNVRHMCYKVEPRYIAGVPASTPADPVWLAHYKPKSQIFVAMNCKALYNGVGTSKDRILAHDYFNADSNGDPAVSEFIVGYTNFGLQATKPTNATAPRVMADFLYSSSQPLTVMASFYDQWVYVFTDGTLASGGPADNVAWLASETYPQSDWLSKFYDGGDPDMTKVVRWLWTTGQRYNSNNLMAGIVYNNSPTAVSFVDFNFNIITLAASDGTYWTIGVDDDGAITLTQTTDTTFLTTLSLLDSNGASWAFTVLPGGILDVNAGTSGGTNPNLVSPSGFQFQMTVTPGGVPDMVAIFAPDVAAIVPGSRVAVLPLVNGVSGERQGKYFQIYFSGIGILSQFSMDLIMKGRRK